MENCKTGPAIVFVVVVLTSLILSVSECGARLLLDIDVRGVYEDNITGSSADIDKRGDYYSIMSASVGGYEGVGKGTFLFLRGDAAGYLYKKYTDLNSAIIGVSAGAYKEFSDFLSGEATLRVRRKEYKETGRSSNAFSGVFELKQRVLTKLWIKEGYEFEKNVAGADIFSYEGHLFGVWSGYSISPGTMVSVGYSYLIREYEEPSGFRNSLHTGSLAFTVELLHKVYLNAGYYRQHISSDIHGSHTNNIYTLGILYSY